MVRLFTTTHGSTETVAPKLFDKRLFAGRVVLPLVLLPLLLAVAVADAAADSAVLSVAATVLSKGNCKFRSGAAALDFGALDPGSSVDATVYASMTFRCQGSPPFVSFFVSDDDGLHEAGPDASRMSHSASPGEYLPYRLTYTPVSGTVPRLTDQVLALTATVRAADVANALAGNYSDTVVLSIVP